MSASFTLFVADTATTAAAPAAQTTAPAAPAAQTTAPAAQATNTPAVEAKGAPAKQEVQATTEQPANPEAVPQAEPGFLETFGGLIPFILIIVVMFYLMYRGQKKEQKRRQDMITSIKKGDKVVTIGGIHGSIFEVKEDTFVITIAANTNIEVGKAAVATIVPETTTIEADQK